MVYAVQVAGEAGVEPPAALVLSGAVARVQIVVHVLGGEGHVVVVAERVAGVSGVAADSQPVVVPGVGHDELGVFRPVPET